MHISLTPELESRIEVKLTRVREQLKVGIKQLDRGKGIVIESKAALDTLFDDIKG